MTFVNSDPMNGKRWNRSREPGNDWTPWDDIHPGELSTCAFKFAWIQTPLNPEGIISTLNLLITILRIMGENKAVL